MTAITEKNILDLPTYKSHFFIRLSAITLIAAGILTSLACTGQFSRFFHALSQMGSWKPLVGGGASFSVLVLGSLFIIRKARQRLGSGKIWGNTHWRKVQLPVEEDGYSYICKCHLDFSKLDAKGNGYAFCYSKSISNATQTGVWSVLATPIYTSVVIVYNLIRFFVVPFYVAVQLVRERGRKDPLNREERAFTLWDIPKQMLLSIQRIVQAPFYGLALFFASFYAVIDPMNGIKLGSAIEYDWNDHVPMRESGIWMLSRTVYKNWRWEGGGGPEKLGQNGFYYAGSWLPRFKVKCIEWERIEIKEVSGEKMDKATIRMCSQIAFINN